MGILLFNSKRADTMASGLCILFLTIIIPCQSFLYRYNTFKNIGWFSTEEPPTRPDVKNGVCEWTGQLWLGKEPDAQWLGTYVFDIYANDPKQRIAHFPDRWHRQFEMNTFHFGGICPASPNLIILKLLAEDYVDKLHLDRIVLLNSHDASNKSYVFKCDCWIDNGETKYINGSIDWLTTQEPHTTEFCDWKLTVWTGKAANAGTKDNVTLEIFESDFQYIKAFILVQSGNPFNQGMRASFTLPFKCTTPSGVNVAVRGSDEMLLDRIEIQRKDDSSSKYVFDCDCWVTKDSKNISSSS